MQVTIRKHVMGDILTMAHRNLLKTIHNPDNLSDVVFQPVIFTLLFGYLFGGVIAGSVHAYFPLVVIRGNGLGDRGGDGLATDCGTNGTPSRAGVSGLHRVGDIVDFCLSRVISEKCSVDWQSVDDYHLSVDISVECVYSYQDIAKTFAASRQR